MSYRRSPKLRLEILYRTGFSQPHTYRSELREARGVWVPVSHAWWEGPRDLHVHFGYKRAGGSNPGHQPYYSEHAGDYIIPDPTCLSGFVRAYSLMIVPREEPCTVDLPKATPAYIRRLREVWASPNEAHLPGTYATVVAYDALLRKCKKP